MEDKRNLVDKYKYKSLDFIKRDLNKNKISLEIAIENLERDFNMGTIIRTANAFNVNKVYIIGRKQWNKRGAMMTDKYLDIVYCGDINEFLEKVSRKIIIAVENNIPSAKPLQNVNLPKNCVLCFGSESSGISEELIKHCNHIASIEQSGSTRSINVGVAAGISMYEWYRRNKTN